MREYNGFNELTYLYRDAYETRYTYRPDGLRQKKLSADGTTLSHIWDGQDIVAEYGANGNITARYLRGINLVARDQDNLLQYYLFNAHGDVTQRTDQNGTALKNYDYDAFGVEKNPEILDVNPWRYCGEYFDREADTLYLRARSYQPSTGRFLSEDVARDGLNWYTYCGNNPIGRIDPSGMADEDARGTAAFRNKYGKTNDSIFDIWGRISQRIAKYYSTLYYNQLAGQHIIEGSDPLTPGLAAEYQEWADFTGTLTGAYLQGLIAGAAIESGVKAYGSLRGGGLVKEGLGKISGNTYDVTRDSIDTIKNHLDQLDYAPENTAMIQRLEQALANGQRITGGDASFYLHELHEAGLMQGGMNYRIAHQAALDYYGVSRYSVYHPEVIQAFPEWFNDDWFK